MKLRRVIPLSCLAMTLMMPTTIFAAEEKTVPISLTIDNQNGADDSIVFTTPASIQYSYDESADTYKIPDEKVSVSGTLSDGKALVIKADKTVTLTDAGTGDTVVKNITVENSINTRDGKITRNVKKDELDNAGSDLNVPFSIDAIDSDEVHNGTWSGSVTFSIDNVKEESLDEIDMNKYIRLMTPDRTEYSSDSGFLGSREAGISLSRGEIDNVRFANYNASAGHSLADLNCWDVSENKDGSIIAWSESKTGSVYKDVRIAPAVENKDILLPEDCSMLFSYFTGSNFSLDGLSNNNFKQTTNFANMFKGSYIASSGYTSLFNMSWWHDCLSIPDGIFQNVNIRQVSSDGNNLSLGSYIVATHMGSSIFKGTDVLGYTLKISSTIKSIESDALEGVQLYDTSRLVYKGTAEGSPWGATYYKH